MPLTFLANVESFDTAFGCELSGLWINLTLPFSIPLFAKCCGVPTAAWYLFVPVCSTYCDQDLIPSSSLPSYLLHRLLMLWFNRHCCHQGFFLRALLSWSGPDSERRHIFFFPSQKTWPDLQRKIQLKPRGQTLEQLYECKLGTNNKKSSWVPSTEIAILVRRVCLSSSVRLH